MTSVSKENRLAVTHCCWKMEFPADGACFDIAIHLPATPFIIYMYIFPYICSPENQLVFLFFKVRIIYLFLLSSSRNSIVLLA